MSLPTACVYCDRPIVYDRQRGFVHRGGGAYVMRCEPDAGGCGWEGPQPLSGLHCPRCHKREPLRDDHCVLPDRSGGAA